MSLVRTLIAYCDFDECQAAHELESTTQPFVELSKIGWKVDHELADEISTFCPTHNVDDYVHLLTGTGGTGLTACGKLITPQTIDGIEYSVSRADITCPRCGS